MRFNLSLMPSATSNGQQNLLNVTVMPHNPPRSNALLDANWNCSGFALHAPGSPFALFAVHHPTQMATFSGACRKCGGVDTIFGQWVFIHPPEDCRSVHMFIDTRRDIFRQDVFDHLRKQAAAPVDSKRADHNSTATVTSSSLVNDDDDGNDDDPVSV